MYSLLYKFFLTHIRYKRQVWNNMWSTHVSQLAYTATLNSYVRPVKIQFEFVSHLVIHIEHTRRESMCTQTQTNETKITESILEADTKVRKRRSTCKIAGSS